MAFVDPTVPNLADFTTFVEDQGVPADDLPSDSSYVQWAFNYAVAAVMQESFIPPTVYVIAVYNYGMHYLLHIAVDQTGQTFFTDARESYGLLSFKGGAVVSASDQGTSGTVSGSRALSNLSLAAMDMLKTPWGQQYLFYAQQFGPQIVAFS